MTWKYFKSICISKSIINPSNMVIENMSIKILSKKLWCFVLSLLAKQELGISLHHEM